MINPLNITVPITPAAFHRFAMNAQAEGISLAAYLARISERGFSIPISELIAETLSDAEDAARQRNKATLAAA